MPWKTKENILVGQEFREYLQSLSDTFQVLRRNLQLQVSKDIHEFWVLLILEALTMHRSTIFYSISITKTGYLR